MFVLVIFTKAGLFQTITFIFFKSVSPYKHLWQKELETAQLFTMQYLVRIQGSTCNYYRKLFIMFNPFMTEAVII